VPTTAYILALEERVEKLKRDIAELENKNSALKTPEPVVQSQDEIEVKKGKSSPETLLETIVGAVRIYI
jgi:phage shock protein A